MLKEYQGKVTVKIDGIAASAASVIAMSGDEIFMSPVAMMMIHNPATVIFGEASDFQSGIDMLSEVKESIINAYENKTGLNRNKISKMMDAETWFSANKAVELGFADKVLYNQKQEEDNEMQDFIFDKISVSNALGKKISVHQSNKTENKEEKEGTSHSHLLKRLELIK